MRIVIFNNLEDVSVYYHHSAIVTATAPGPCNFVPISTVPKAHCKSLQCNEMAKLVYDQHIARVCRKKGKEKNGIGPFPFFQWWQQKNDREVTRQVIALFYAG